MRNRLPPYVYRERTRHGRWVFYFRRGKGRRVRLPDDPTSPDFESAYHAALIGNAPPVARDQAPSQGSLRWLVDRYRESAAWRQLAPATRRQRERIFLRAIQKADNAPFAAITQAHIQEVMDRRADTPAQANHFLKSMRGLFAWAVRNEHVRQDPTIGVQWARYRSEGFPAWTPDDAQAFRDRHPVGSKPRLAMELLLLTGLRRSDLVRVGRQHLRGDVLTVPTVKTGTTVTIRLPATLLQLIELTPTGDMHFVVNEHGRPFAVDSFGNWFHDRCREAGIKKSAHGLRKLSATLAAEGGAAAHQLMAQYGWSKIVQAEVYTKAADRVRLGKQSSEIVAGQIENNIPRTLVSDAPHPSKKVSKS
ncbi:MAG: tyrosine-type recombinase/integrase [Alphaproteobacteria bacterium]|nr:tyrosine-type recombinase/integrase [Alphaproteobacteria bacterium]